MKKIFLILVVISTNLMAASDQYQKLVGIVIDADLKGNQVRIKTNDGKYHTVPKEDVAIVKNGKLNAGQAVNFNKKSTIYR